MSQDPQTDDAKHPGEMDEQLEAKVKDVSLDDLQKKVEELEREDQEKQVEEGEIQEPVDEISELKNALARALADLQNYKRRAEEDKARWIKFANAELLNNLLNVVDHFNRSIDHLPEELEGDDWVKGVLQIHEEFGKTLEKAGVKKMECVGEKLDPNKHEAMLSGPGEKDVITEEFEKGYTYHDQVLRPAKVKVGDGSKK